MAEVFGACFKGDLAAVKKWVSSNSTKVDDLSADRECTLLYTAARAGHLPIVKYLVEEGEADVDKQNGAKSNSSTPLHGAAYGGHPEVLEYLVEQGAQLIENAFGDTAREDIENSEAAAKIKKKCKDILKGMKAVTGTATTVGHKRDAKAVDPNDLPNMTLAELRSICKSEGISAKGKKSDIIKLLQNHYAPAKPAAAAAPTIEDALPPKKKPKKAGKAAAAAAPAAVSTPTPAPLPTPSSTPDASGMDWTNVSNESVEELKAASYTLTEIPKDTPEFWNMEEKLSSSLQGRNEDYVKNRLVAKKKPITFVLVKAEKVDNPTLAKRFEARKKEMTKENPEYGRERLSYHGSSPKNLPSILKTSLLRFKHPLNPCKSQVDDGYFGTNKKGVYVSRYSDYTFKYTNGLEPLDAGQTCTTIMFRTLPGKSKHIPKLSGPIDPTPGFHSHSSPSYLEWYLFSEDQLCPEYLLTVKAVEDTRTVSDDE